MIIQLIADLHNLSNDGRYRNKETLHKLRHLYSIITGENQFSTQLAFLNEHAHFLLSLAGLSMPNMNLTERHARMKEKREKLARMKSKLDYFTRCTCGVKYGKVNWSHGVVTMEWIIIYSRATRWCGRRGRARGVKRTWMRVTFNVASVSKGKKGIISSINDQLDDNVND